MDRDAKILIVDDVPENLRVLGQILDTRNYEVSFAMDGQQAIESAKADMPDLILLDINMPVMDGYQACLELKANPKTKAIPVIFLTAKNETEDLVKGFDYGAVDYVTKPFSSKELLQRVKTHIELKQSKEDLEQSIAEKNKFFSIIAHDLRTPFNALIGFSNLLLIDDDVDQEEKEQFIKIINDTSKKGLGLLENLLLWASSQTGRMEHKPELFSLKTVVDDVVNLLYASAVHKQVEIKVLVDQAVEIYADRQAINTVLRNLLSNALKYTYAKGLVIIQAVQNEKFVRISVSDNGLGMPDSVQQDLFKYDKKVVKKGTDNENGSGLGLLLCKELTEQNKGKISLKSVLGEGTAFFIDLPTAQGLS